jgi:hypothetical protein
LIRVVPARLFTPTEANSALADVRPLVEALVALRGRLRELEGRQRSLVTTIGGNGAGHAAGELGAAHEEFETLAGDFDDCIVKLDAVGVEVKDADSGLVDFPALRDGHEVLLCWRLGEESVDHWHDREAGFAGRKPIDWDE